ncbi:MAG TPA: ABC transporter permease, partial [Methylophilaceae bacterium]|nr:ABC transporter permease [Methylophilaceae bacterium]
LAFLAASIIRGLVVGLCIYLVAMWFVELPMAHPWLILAFAVLGSALLGAFGIVAGIWADKFDQMAAFQNFIIMPLSFLSGVFYSIHSLPPFWQKVSQLNPFFYMIDGFRYGFFGVGDISPTVSLSVVGACFFGLSWLTLKMLKSGYKLRG